ncbi:unnamed protein product [Paramecium octaurelia]|uniref:Ribosomal protein L9 n=1 Tax=Paramecium octaurelia TaxID=43137 RepID=A0A8S1RWF6_PAROT|nr:unnamed protein product [Paramecium octaurelia]
MKRGLQYFFSKQRMEIFFLKDCVQGFQGEIRIVKPGFFEKYLFPMALAYQNLPGYRRRLLPNLDEEKLEHKIQRRKDIKLFQQKIAGIHLEFVRPPKFSNPSLLKDPIDDKLIIEEVQQRFKLQITKNHLLSMVNKINTYGQFTLQIENFYSPELQDYTTFQITVVTKKPIMKVQKLIDEVATKDEQNKDENKDKQDQKVVKQGKEKEKEKETQK